MTPQTFTIADSRFLCAASAVSLWIASGPMRQYADGAGVVLFHEDISALGVWSGGGGAAILARLVETAEPCRAGPLGELAGAAREVARVLSDEHPHALRAAAVAKFMLLAARANFDRAKALAA